MSQGLKTSVLVVNGTAMVASGVSLCIEACNVASVSKLLEELSEMQVEIMDMKGEVERALERTREL